ncbi:MAG: hypothetical protein IKL24_00710 [Clostridia bacterium]|nr:hypothetical protein [Clostridia bacterium]
MKKTITAVILLSLVCLLMFSCASNSGTKDTTADDDPKVTSPDGFEDVTAPPVNTDTTADSNESTPPPETNKPEPDTDTAAPETDTDAPDENTTEPDDTGAPDTDTGTPELIITNNAEAIEAARNFLGLVDSETGYQYAYSNDGMLTENGIEYFKVRVSWIIVEEERLSLCGYLLVSPYGDVTKYDW